MLRRFRTAIRLLLHRVRLQPSLGARGETAAADYLKRQGYRILARQQRLRSGEIDLVALDGQTVVFVEVKTRRSRQKGGPGEAVERSKQRRLTRAATAYLKRHGLLDCPARFDVVAVTWPTGDDRPHIEHFQHAFEATGL